MKAIFVLFSLFFLAVTAQSWDDSSWTDSDYGGTMYVCFDDDDVHAAYSEFGVAHGNRNGNTISGNWYEPGTEDCFSGSFEWTLGSSGNSFTGFWTCADDDDERDWSETLISGASSTSDVLCAVFDHDEDVTGAYTLSGTTFDICIDDDEYEASFSTSGVDGYETGVVYEDGAVVAGEYEVENGVTGISLVFRLRDGRLGNFYWRYDDNDNIDTVADYNTSAHGYDLYTRIGGASDSECKANENFNNNNNNDDDDDSSSSNSSNDDDDDSSSSSSRSDDDDSSSATAVFASVAFVIAAALI